MSGCFRPKAEPDFNDFHAGETSALSPKADIQLELVKRSANDPKRTFNSRVGWSKYRMRLWSLHPKYLDAKGLVALWREGLLAQKVLRGNTSGYKNHPQLIRFKDLLNPVSGVREYLYHVHKEALARSYNFDQAKIGVSRSKSRICVSTGQVAYEAEHLLRKLESRDPSRYEQLIDVDQIEAHPMFDIFEGQIADWEVR